LPDVAACVTESPSWLTKEKGFTYDKTGSLLFQLSVPLKRKNQNPKTTSTKNAE
jgi:hypothetical protein